MLNYSNVDDLNTILTNEVNPSGESVRLAKMKATIETAIGNEKTTDDENSNKTTEANDSADHLVKAVDAIDKTMKIINVLCIWC